MNHFNYGIIIGAIESAPLLGAYIFWVCLLSLFPHPHNVPQIKANISSNEIVFLMFILFPPFTTLLRISYLNYTS